MKSDQSAFNYNHQQPNSDVRSACSAENTIVTRDDKADNNNYGEIQNKKRQTESGFLKVRVPKKRNRRTLVCSYCRKRKIKCDKQMPCHNCVKTHRANTCKYTTERNPEVYQEEKVADIWESTKKQKTGVSLKDHEEQQQPESGQKDNEKSGQNEVEQLKSKINELQALLNSSDATNKVTKSSVPPMNGFNGEPKTQNITSQNSTSSILNMKLHTLKPVIITMENRNISYHGPLSHFQMTNSSHILISKFITKQQQKKKTKNQNQESRYVVDKPIYFHKLLNTTIEEGDLIKRLKTQLLPHYDALLSRIRYFGSYLNDLLYNGILDMSMVISLFHTFFIKCDFNKIKSKEETNISGNFLKLRNGAIFADLALVLCVIQSTFPFCDVDLSLASSSQLSKETEIALSQLSMDALACSRIGVELNYSALLSLVLMNDIHYSYSSHGDETFFDELNSFSLLHDTINLAFKLGLHRDPTSIPETAYQKVVLDGDSDDNDNDDYDYGSGANPPYILPPMNSRTLWSRLKQLDASHSVYSGEPLVIMDQFSDSCLSAVVGNNSFTDFTDLQRELALLMNSVTSSISLDDVLLLRKKYMMLNSSLGSFQSLIESREVNLGQSELIKIAHCLSLKMKVCRVLILLNSFLCGLINDPDKFPNHGLNEANRHLLKKVALTLKCESLKITLLVWKIWILLASGDEDTVLGHNNEFYVVYLKHDLFPLSIAIFEQTMSCCLRFSLGMVLNRKESMENLMNTDPVISLETIDLLELEESMVDKVDGSESHADPVGDEVSKLFEHPRQLVCILKEVYRSSSISTTFMNAPGFSSLLDLMSLLCCFVESTVKQAEETKLSVSINEDASSNNTSIFSKQGRKTLEREMKLNAEILEFNSNDESIRDWLNVVFNRYTIAGFMKGFDSAHSKSLLETSVSYNFRTSSITTTTTNNNNNNNNKHNQDNSQRNVDVTDRVKANLKTVTEIETNNSYVFPFNRLMFQAHEQVNADSDSSNDANNHHHDAVNESIVAIDGDDCHSNVGGHEEKNEERCEDIDDSNGLSISSTGSTLISQDPTVHKGRLKSTGMKRNESSSVGGSYQIFF
ncbi:unnamed protein product [Ambrosiozyma monospora]|uniref:Unnamed protein product n=1 Tax=Ambrosiozyma monospora TaxID=43982 RepID=A0A9W7DIP3_AMBMO|nr:unnamed protein product [Ambrosiozyma monospora]